MCPSNEKIANTQNQFSIAHLCLLYREDPRTAICLQRHCSRRASAAIPPDVDISPNITDISNTNVIQNCYCAATTPAKCCPSNTSNARFCNLYKSRKTKSTLFLIIFFCAIVLQKSSAIPVTSSGQRLILHTFQYRQRQHQEILDQWRQQAPPPTPPHHRHHLHQRSASNMPKVNAKICEEIRALQGLANRTYDSILPNFGNYILLHFHNTTDNVLTSWSRHQLQMNHSLKEVLVRNFTNMPDQSLFQHLANENFSNKSIEREMHKVYDALNASFYAFQYVINYRRENSSRLRHDFKGTEDEFNTTQQFFHDIQFYLQNNLDATKASLVALHMEIPTLEEPKYNFSSDPMLRELLLTSEHLSVYKHILALYNYLLDKMCEHQQV